MTKLIILSGGSGYGKTTMCNHMEKQPGVMCLGSGEFFKTLYGLCGFGAYDAKEKLIFNDAFSAVMALKADGLRLYEEKKEHNPNNGANIIRFIESIRSLCPDIAPRSVLKQIELTDPEIAVTVVINMEEVQQLYALCEAAPFIEEVHFFEMDCIDPRPANSAVIDNRHQLSSIDVMEATDHLKCAKSWHGWPYHIEDSIEFADDVLAEVR